MSDGRTGNASGSVIDVEAVLAWLNRDRLVDLLSQEVDDLADDAAALVAGDRAARLSELGAELLAAERLEEAAIELIEESGGKGVPRREQADIRAVLGLADAAPAPARE